MNEPTLVRLSATAPTLQIEPVANGFIVRVQPHPTMHPGVIIPAEDTRVFETLDALKHHLGLIYGTSKERPV